MSKITGGSKAVMVGHSPYEPQNKTVHDGVFSSHYDQRRLTRIIGRSKLWVDI